MNENNNSMQILQPKQEPIVPIISIDTSNDDIEDQIPPPISIQENTIEHDSSTNTNEKTKEKEKKTRKKAGTKRKREDLQNLDEMDFELSEFKCPRCRMKFTSTNDLFSHMRDTYTDATTCHVCGKKLNAMANLLSHSYIHTGERPYKCPNCDYSTRTRFNLKVHFGSCADVEKFSYRRSSIRTAEGKRRKTSAVAGNAYKRKKKYFEKENNKTSNKTNRASHNNNKNKNNSNSNQSNSNEIDSSYDIDDDIDISDFRPIPVSMNNKFEIQDTSMIPPSLFTFHNVSSNSSHKQMAIDTNDQKYLISMIPDISLSSLSNVKNINHDTSCVVSVNINDIPSMTQVLPYMSTNNINYQYFNSQLFDISAPSMMMPSFDINNNNNISIMSMNQLQPFNNINNINDNDDDTDPSHNFNLLPNYSTSQASENISINQPFITNQNSNLQSEIVNANTNDNNNGNSSRQYYS